VTSNYEQSIGAIKNANPEDFDQIFDQIQRLSNNEVKNNLIAAAILFLKAGNDPVLAASICNELIGPGQDRNEILENCLFLANPGPIASIEFLRKLEHPEEATYLIKARFDAIFAREDSLDLIAKSQLKLSSQESNLVIRGLSDATFPPFSDLSLNDEAAKFELHLKSITGAINKGLLSVDSGNKFLLFSSKNRPELIFHIFKSEEQLKSILAKSEYNPVIQQISSSNPERFFSPTGKIVLPDNKISLAWTGWMEKNSVDTSQWFSENQQMLSPAQKDQIAISNTNYAIKYKEYETASKWIGLINDTTLQNKAQMRLSQNSRTKLNKQ